MANEGKWHRREIIGKNIKATYNKRHIIGKIIDESKETFTILEKENKKILLKNNLTITQINGEKIHIKGKDLNVKPYERIKLR